MCFFKKKEAWRMWKIGAHHFAVFAGVGDIFFPLVVGAGWMAPLGETHGWRFSPPLLHISALWTRMNVVPSF